ncbi:MAG: DUF202 domain-containing protein [Planctomycetota bacterium]
MIDSGLASKDTSTDPASTVRDELAIIRTHLANERTFLAYIRTALMLAGTGGTLIKFFSDDVALKATGYVSIVGAIGVLTIGLIRFRRSALRAEGLIRDPAGQDV